MNATTTIQSGTIQMKRSHLVGLVVGVVALSVALTTGAQAVLDSSDTSGSIAPTSYVEGVTAMTPEELAATFGDAPVYSPQAYVDAVTAMTPEELATTWGSVPVGNARQDYIDAVSEMTPAERRGDVGQHPHGSVALADRPALRGHALEADEAAGELDLAHVAQTVLVDPALGGVEQGDALAVRRRGRCRCWRSAAGTGG